MSIVRFSLFFTLLAMLPLGAACGGPSPRTMSSTSDKPDEKPAALETAVFGGGCFWCLEAIFQRMPGVVSVRPGYAGGHVAHPTYRQVCSGRTGHAEVVQIRFDPKRISYDQLLDLFWKAHDPTQKNRQGPDVGTQYRSIILTRGKQQRRLAEASKKRWEKAGLWKGTFTTEIVPAGVFYPAEDYHRDYYNRNPRAAYCVFNIAPKLRKLGLSKKNHRDQEPDAPR